MTKRTTAGILCSNQEPGRQIGLLATARAIAASNGSTELAEVLSSTDAGRAKISLISKFGEKTDDIYGGKIATGKSLRRGTKSTGTQVLRSISALDHDSRRAGLSNCVAGHSDHGTHRSVSLCLASSTLLRRAGCST